MKLLSSVKENLQANWAFRQGRVKCQGVDINLTGNCTYDCLLCECRQLDPRSDLTTKELFGVADQMVEEGILSVFFGGGEPLMRPDFLELLRYFSGKGISISTVTNGSLPNKLSDEALAVIDQCVDTLMISVDSSIPEQYNELRNHGKAYPLALATMERLSRLERCKKGITAVICRNNYPGLPGLMELARKFRLDSVVFQPVSDGPNYPELAVRDRKSELMLRPADLPGLKAALDQAENAAARYEIHTNVERLRSWVFQYFDNHASGRIFHHGMIDAYSCIIAFSRVCIRHNGDIQLCALVPGQGNVRQSRLKDLIAAEFPVKEGLRRGELTDNCSKCFCGMDANLRFSMTYRPIKNFRYLVPIIKEKLSR